MEVEEEGHVEAVETEGEEDKRSGISEEKEEGNPDLSGMGLEERKVIWTFLSGNQKKATISVRDVVRVAACKALHAAEVVCGI